MDRDSEWSREGEGFTLDNDPTTSTQIIFQVPWSEAQKWQQNARWKIIAFVQGASAENDVTDNNAEHEFALEIPNLQVTSGTIDPTPNGGEFFPGQDILTNVEILNSGEVRTQEGVFFPRGCSFV